jgi:hypothetical protein
MAIVLGGLLTLFAWLKAHHGVDVGTAWRDVTTFAAYLRAEVHRIDLGAAVHHVATFVSRLRAAVHLAEDATSGYWHTNGM